MKRYSNIVNILALVLISSLITGCWSDPGSNRFNPGKMGDFQTREVSDFERIELDGNFVLLLNNSSECSLSIKGDGAVLDLLLIEVDNNTLKIGYMNEKYTNMGMPVVVKVGVKNLKELSGKNTLRVITHDVFSFDHLRLYFAGAVNLDMKLEGNSLSGVFAGASSMDLMGKVDTLKFEIPGAGKMRAFELEVKEVDLNLAGAGKAEIFVTEQLRVNMAGACHISYKGTPSNVYSNISGIGRLKKVD